MSGKIYAGASSIDATAALQVDSTTLGALLPRMTSTQRDAISTPATGLEIYNTTTNQKEFYDGSSWGAVGGGASSQAVTYIVAASDAVDTTGADYVCDGTADDVQIQAALDAVDTAGFGTVYLSEGTFTFASPVVIDASNTTLRGAGRGVTTLEGLTSGDGYIELAPGTGNTIRDITLSDFTINGGASGTTSTIGQIFQDDSGVIERLLIERIRITGTSSTLNGITFENATGTNKWVTIRDCIIELSATTIYGISFRKTTQYLWVEDCHVELSSATSYNAIAVYADAEGFHVNNNYATSGHSPIAVSPANNGEVIGNTVDGMNVTSEGGIEVEWKSSHLGTDTSHHVAVSNNIVRGGYWGIFITRRDTDAPNPGAPTDVTISHNIIEATNNDGIRVSYGIRVALIGNMIGNAGVHGIGLLETTDVLVQGNVITNAASVSIRSEGAASDSAVMILGNVIDSGGSDGILLESGSGNYIIKDNYLDGIGAYGINVKTDNGIIDSNWIGTAASGNTNDTGTGNVFIRNSGNAVNPVHLDGSAEISTLTELVSPDSGDWVLVEDVSDGNAKKKVQIGNLPSGGGSATPNYGTAAIKTLSTGVAASSTDRNLVIAAETGTTDDMIELTGLTVGDSVWLRADTGDTITVKHNDAGATIKMLVQDGADIVLDESHPIEFSLVSTNVLSQVYDEAGSGSSPLTTKGDIYTYSTLDARLPVGTNGQVLSANSAEATGLEWITSSGSGSSVTRTTSTLIYKKTLGSVGSFDTNDAPDSGSTDLSGYDHLKVIVRARSEKTATNIGTRIYFNNDTTDSNYSSNQAGTVVARPSVDLFAAASALSNFYTFLTIFIPNYTSTDFVKNNHWNSSSYISALTEVEGSFYWNSTSAISRIQVRTSEYTTNDLLANSIIEVYGIKQESIGSATFATTSDDNVSSPPTDAELDSAFGTPATVGNGFIGLLDDAGAGTAVYMVASDGTNWWHTAMTKAV